MTDVTLEQLSSTSNISTADAELKIKMPDQKLSVGKHKFKLVVEDDSGNQSAPALVTVIVVDNTAPTAVLDINDENGRIVSDSRISFGADFILNAQRSVDFGGNLVKYNWSILRD